jgi:hypothetical protein
MLHLRHRVVVDDRHLDAADRQLLHRLLEYLICMEMMTELNHLDVEQILNLYPLVVVHLVGLQNLDEQSLGERPPFLDVVRR